MHITVAISRKQIVKIEGQRRLLNAPTLAIPRRIKRVAQPAVQCGALHKPIHGIHIVVQCFGQIRRHRAHFGRRSQAGRNGGVGEKILCEIF
ncbi:MAG: hypothetical protein R2867_26170 [Caldilineaceae bacterium]